MTPSRSVAIRFNRIDRTMIAKAGVNEYYRPYGLNHGDFEQGVDFATDVANRFWSGENLSPLGAAWTDGSTLTVLYPQ